MKNVKYYAIGAIICGVIAMTIGFSFLFSNNLATKPEKGMDDYISDGNVYLDDGNYTMAIASYQKGLELDENNADALYGIAEAYSGLEYYEEENEVREKISELRPDDVENWIGLVLVKLNLNELTEAKELTEELRNNYENSEINELYEQMNVTTPVFNLQSGSYDSYQLLELESIPKNATVYYTTDGAEPTEDSEIYSEGIVISYPETVIKAKAIGYLGYESDVTELNYQITVPVKDVRKSHFQYEWYLDDYLNKSSEAPIYNYEVAQIRELYILGDDNLRMEEESEVIFHEGYYMQYESQYDDWGNRDIDFLTYVPFLKKLCIGYQKRLDISVLSELSYLEEVSLLNCNIKELDEFRNLKQLRKLALGWNQIEDVSPLAELTNLESLGLWNNRIQNISALSNLTALRYFDVSGNQLEDIECIKNMSELDELWISNNQIRDFTVLDSCEGLSVLMASDNPASESYILKENMSGLGKTDMKLGGE